MASQHDAFLSYTRIDDEFHGGAITSLRKFIELGVQVVTGNRNFVIFQDVDGIEFGEQWQKRIDQAITDTSFLIPIITPLFFQSSACRDELEKFVEHERALGRDDLILPIYFVTAPLLEKTELLKADALASEIHKRQRFDWRSQADLPINDPKVRVAIRDLCEKIDSAISRTMRPIPTHSPPVKFRIDPGERAERIRKAVSRDAAFQKASEAVKREEPAKGKTRNQVWRVLWVDDRPDNNITERQAMEAYNIEFTLALSTGDALAKLRVSQFDAIISDMDRPPDPRAGYTLLEALRGSGDMTPYFIYARSNDPKHAREAISRGAQGSTNNGSKLLTAVLKSISVVIYVSYRRLDNAPPDNGRNREGFVNYLMREIRARLQELGVTDVILWQDRSVIAPDDEWNEEITDALNRAELFIVILSKNYITSSWCEKELHAIESRVEMFGPPAEQRRVFRVDKHKIPEDEVPESLRGIQSVRFYREEDGHLHEYFWGGKVRLWNDFDGALDKVATGIGLRLEELRISRRSAEKILRPR